MKFLFLDPFSGISGDMFLASLFDAGLPYKQLEKELSSSGIKGFSFEVKRASMKGLRGLRVAVRNGEKRVFQTYRECRKFLRSLFLKKEIRGCVEEAFETLFRIESRVHGRRVENLIFHELGQLDTVVDVVGGLLAVHMLGIKRVFSSPVNVGGGFTETSHGRLPSPVPVTLELLRGMPLFRDGSGELTTPTGALLLKALNVSFPPSPRFSVERVGYGMGRYEWNSFPDALRVIIGEEFKEDEVMMIEANIDDMPPFLFEDLFDNAFKAGALEIYVTPVVMKKSRPAYLVSILSEKDRFAEVASTLFHTTTTIGLRYYPVSRIELKREVEERKVGKEKVLLKKTYWLGRPVNLSWEYSSLKELASRKKVTIKEILQSLKGKGGL